MGLFGKKFKCEACGGKFNSQDELMNHRQTHMQEDHASHKHFIYKACGSEFHSELELKSHGQQAHM